MNVASKLYATHWWHRFYWFGGKGYKDRVEGSKLTALCLKGFGKYFKTGLDFTDVITFCHLLKEV